MRKEPLVRLIDDDPTVLAAQSTFLRMADLKVLTYSSASDFLEKDDFSRPGCLVLDVRMPSMTGLELQDEMIRQKIDLPIIFLSAHGDIAMAVRAVQKGAKTFLVKPPNLEQLLEEIDSAIKLCFSIRDEKLLAQELQDEWNQLTEAEKKIAKLVVKGLSNQTIAEIQSVSEKTVRSQRASVYTKLEVENAAELTNFLRDYEKIEHLL